MSCRPRPFCSRVVLTYLGRLTLSKTRRTGSSGGDGSRTCLTTFSVGPQRLGPPDRSFLTSVSGPSGTRYRSGEGVRTSGGRGSRRWTEVGGSQTSKDDGLPTPVPYQAGRTGSVPDLCRANLPHHEKGGTDTGVDPVTTRGLPETLYTNNLSCLWSEAQL